MSSFSRRCISPCYSDFLPEVPSTTADFWIFPQLIYLSLSIPAFGERSLRAHGETVNSGGVNTCADGFIIGESIWQLGEIIHKGFIVCWNLLRLNVLLSVTLCSQTLLGSLFTIYEFYEFVIGLFRKKN